VAAVETAILDALTRQLDIPLYKFFGGQSAKLATDITIVISHLAETEETAKKYYRQGFVPLKLRSAVTRTWTYSGCWRLKGCEEFLLILDANQGYTAATDLKVLKRS